MGFPISGKTIVRLKYDYLRNQRARDMPAAADAQ